MKSLLFSLMPAGRAVLILAASLTFTFVASADIIYLHGGRQVEGVVDQDASDTEQVTIRTAATTLRISRVNIDRIEGAGDRSYSEASGDLMASSGNLEKALEQYQNALAYDPGNAQLQQKIDALRERMQDAEHQEFGRTFDQIDEALERRDYEIAVERITGLIERTNSENVQTHARELLAQAYMGIARQMRDRVLYPEAERYYQLAVEAYPEGAAARLEFADLLQGSPARKAEAIQFYAEGIRILEANPAPAGQQSEEVLDYKVKLGRLYLDEKQFGQAAEAFLEVTRLDSNYRYPDAVEFAVDAYSRIPLSELAAQSESAIQNLRSIIEDRPADARGYLLLGQIYFNLGDFQQARDLLSQGVSLAGSTTDRTVQDSMFSLGQSHRKLGELDEAANMINRLVALRTGNYEALIELGEIRLEQNDTEEARRRFEEAIQLDQDRYPAYLGLGSTLRRIGEYDDARDNLEKVVDRDENNAEAQLLIALTYRDEEELERMEVEAEKAVTLVKNQLDGASTKAAEPADPELDGEDTEVEGEAEAEEGLTDQQLIEMEITPEQKDVLARAWTMMGESNLKQKNTNRARELFEMALARLPDHAPAMNGIGMSYQMETRNDEAEEAYAKAMAADPTEPDYALSMAILQHNFLKNPDKALPLYLAYLELGGRDSNVQKWVEDLGGTVSQEMEAALAAATDEEDADSASLMDLLSSDDAAGGDIGFPEPMGMLDDGFTTGALPMVLPPTDMAPMGLPPAGFPPMPAPGPGAMQPGPAPMGDPNALAPPAGLDGMPAPGPAPGLAPTDAMPGVPPAAPPANP